MTRQQYSRATTLGLLGALGLFVSQGCGAHFLSPSELEDARWQTARTFPDHRESDITFRSTDGTRLSGTLMLPFATGSYTTIVLHYGSDRWTRSSWADVHGWVLRGVAVFTYDKRGVGQSGGECCYTSSDRNYFSTLGGDVMAAAHAVQQHPEARRHAVGVFGFSQGGWVVPVAAAGDPEDIDFTIIGSGPAVSVGEELLYSSLTGEAACRPTGLTAEEIDQRLAAAGPSEFDPRPYLERLARPALWIYGGLDRSIPVERSARALREIAQRTGHAFDIEVVPNINHGWIVDGGLCQDTGVRWDNTLVIWPWLRSHGFIE